VRGFLLTLVCASCTLTKSRLSSSTTWSTLISVGHPAHIRARCGGCGFGSGRHVHQDTPRRPLWLSHGLPTAACTSIGETQTNLSKSAAADQRPGRQCQTNELVELESTCILHARGAGQIVKNRRDCFVCSLRKMLHQCRRQPGGMSAASAESPHLGGPEKDPVVLYRC
jgi:hypothetical protein